MVLFLGLATENEDVIHTDDYHPFFNEFLEDIIHIIHHFLEYHQAVSETKEND